MMKALATWIFKTWGWSTEGPLPYDTKKCLVVVYPHTSNWDFPIGILFRLVYGIPIGFVGKHTLFKPPFGFIMRWLGGKPVVRTGNTNFVQGVVNIFKETDEFRLCVTPEGTRSKTKGIKSGFHHIAALANVPIVYCAFHWDTKTMRWSEPHYVDENYDNTVESFHKYFKGTIGYRPEDAYEIPA